MRTFPRTLACLAIVVLFSGCGSTPGQESTACETGEDCASGLCIAGVCSDDFTSVSERDAVTVDDVGLVEPDDVQSPDAGTDVDEDTTPEDATREDVVPEDATPEDVVPEDATPEDVVPEDATPEDVVPEDATPEDVVPEDATPEDVVPEDAVLGDVGTDASDAEPVDATPDAPGEDIDAPDVPGEDIDAPDAPGEDIDRPDVADVSDVDPTDTTDDGGGDISAPDADVVEPRNSCGGLTELPVEPDVPCGPCALDVWVCDGTDSLVCSGETVANACGGCDVVELAPGSSCGVCGGGVVVCETDNSTDCVLLGEELNACGGCEALAGMPGSECGTCGSGAWACTDDGGVRCVGDGGDTALNACGGCAALEESPGGACGLCDGGQWVCAGEERIVCREDAPPELNACGGCLPLDAPIGGRCGTCASGVWECDGPDGAICEGDGGDATINLCGGCGDLEEVPGTECGACGELWQCDAVGGVVCIEAPRNACGGCSELDDEPGDSCFRFGCGFAVIPVFACDGDEDVECVCEGPPEGCGDGAWDFANEECDDGNTRNGDACNSRCETEAVLDDGATCGDTPPLPNNGRVLFDICGAEDDSGNATTAECGGSRTGDDVVGQLTITERSRVFVDARDADNSVPVDVVVYLRTTCERENSQIACGDDAACEVAPDIGGCLGDLQPRVAQFTIVLDPGTYFVVVDNYEYDAGSVEFECGDVQLSIFTTAL
ncbi:MAG: hypothetical protein ACI81R_003428 [Bradymonadia bacterium]|jgi:hypothetical protein